QIRNKSEMRTSQTRRVCFGFRASDFEFRISPRSGYNLPGPGDSPFRNRVPAAEGTGVRRLFERQRFVEFGPSRFHPPSHHPERRRVSARGAARLRERVRAECPRVPGVYGMLDADGVLVYVGKAKV